MGRLSSSPPQNDAVAVRPVVAIIGNGFKCVADGGHFFGKFAAKLLESVLVLRVGDEIGHLAGVGLVVKQQFLGSIGAGDAVFCIGILFGSDGPPFVSGIPGGGGSRSLHKDGIRLGAGLAQGQMGQVHPFHP